MLSEAFEYLSPVLIDKYETLLAREFERSPELASLHAGYSVYAVRDRFLPRPVLAYFGYHAFSDVVDFSDADQIGDGLLLPQLLRDFLAIHDDVVDEDAEKFGEAPLPVMYSPESGNGGGGPTQVGKDLGLYYGDFVAAVMLRVAASLRPTSVAAEATSLLANTLYETRRVGTCVSSSSTDSLTASSGFATR